ncbi:oxidoreductase-like domain-containing protein [Spiribacter onubensis]|uniref:Oxidoreductase-like domain-containing protein n=1 Tax=Spiribacter onubensis TaxID=3122420 RepID=A0ABV3SAH4_9GAMM
MRRNNEFPPPPREPDLDECCGSGCDPCVFDLYEQRLERWRVRCEAFRASATGRQESTPEQSRTGSTDGPS